MPKWPPRGLEALDPEDPFTLHSTAWRQSPPPSPPRSATQRAPSNPLLPARTVASYRHQTELYRQHLVERAAERDTESNPLAIAEDLEYHLAMLDRWLDHASGGGYGRSFEDDNFTAYESICALRDEYLPREYLHQVWPCPDSSHLPYKNYQLFYCAGWKKKTGHLWNDEQRGWVQRWAELGNRLNRLHRQVHQTYSWAGRRIPGPWHAPVHVFGQRSPLSIADALDRIGRRVQTMDRGAPEIDRQAHWACLVTEPPTPYDLAETRSEANYQFPLVSDFYAAQEKLAQWEKDWAQLYAELFPKMEKQRAARRQKYSTKKAARTPAPARPYPSSPSPPAPDAHTDSGSDAHSYSNSNSDDFLDQLISSVKFDFME